MHIDTCHNHEEHNEKESPDHEHKNCRICQEYAKNVSQTTAPVSCLFFVEIPKLFFQFPNSDNIFIQIFPLTNLSRGPPAMITT